jgi:hypothetical protein
MKLHQTTAFRSISIAQGLPEYHIRPNLKQQSGTFFCARLCLLPVLDQ